MPGAGRTQVVGGGIGATAPLTVGNFLKLTSASPPAASTSARLIERTASVEVLGDGTTSTAIGAAADANGTNHIAIGNNVSTQPGAGRAIVIGDSIAIPAGSGLNNINIGSVTYSGVVAGSDSIVIGVGATVGGVANSSSVALGNNVTVSGNSSVVVGSGAGVSGNGSVAVGASASSGLNGIALGQLANTGNTGSTGNIVIGVSAIGPTAVNGVILLGNRNGTTPGDVVASDMVLGHQDNSNSLFTHRVWYGGPNYVTSVAVPAYQHAHRKAVGTNIGVGDVTVHPQLATGNAAGGGIALGATVPGASGAVVQTSTVALRVDPSGNITLAAATGSYGTGAGVVFIGNAATNPSTNPTGGGVLYVNAGALTYRGSGGTVTVVAPA